MAIEKNNLGLIISHVSRKLDKDFVKILKPFLANIKKLNNEVKELTKRLDKLAPKKTRKKRTPQNIE
jgi:hypothetical protein